MGGALAATPLLATGTPAQAAPSTKDGVTLRRVTFTAPDGVRLVGHLRIPTGRRVPRPAVLLSNAMTSVKEQSVQTGYAHGLAAAGFVTLVFDQRRFGESGGEPRQHEDNEDRLTDLQAAVSYLIGQKAIVDSGRIGALGVSIGGGLAMKLTAVDPRVGAFVAIAAGLHDPQRIRQLFGGPDAYAAALAEQTAALERYHRTGKMEYIPIVRTSDVPDTQPVLFNSDIATEYYGTARGAAARWQNRASTLSLRTILVHDVRHPVDLVGPRAGLLAVGALDRSTLPEDHQAIYDRLTGPRRLVLLENVGHNDLYDQPQHVGRVVAEAATWFRTHLH
ncbi:alpha/beta hydrolase [Phytohabitans flavus]